MATPSDLASTSGQASRVGSVILCCAAEDRSSADAAAKAVRERGHEVRMLTAVEVQTTTQEDSDDALWVLLRTPRLSGTRIDELRKRLRHLGVPFERTLTVADPSPRLVVERVEQALSRLGVVFRGPPVPPPPPDSGVIPTTAADPNTAEELTTVGRRKQQQTSLSGEHQLIAPDDLADLDALPDEPGIPEPMPEPPPLRRGHTLEALGAAPRAVITGHTFRISNAAEDANDPDADADEIESPTTPMNSDEIPSDALEGLLDGSDTEAGSWWTNPRYLGAVTIATLGVLALVLWASSGDDDEGIDATLAEAEATQPVTPQPRSEPEEPPPDPGPAMPGRPTKVMKALDARQLRALDNLLVMPQASDPMSYEAAVGHCQALSHQGLGGWRVPSLGELGSLDRGGMLEDGFYWSSTPADAFGDVTFSWYGKADRPVTRDEDAPVLCVRDSNADV